MTTKTFTLDEHTQLSYAIYGETYQPKHDVLFFHGLQSCHVEAEALAQTASNLRLRLIAIDRPGTGFSTPVPDRRIVDWASVVEGLVQALNLQTYSILAVSGGGPYALACARHFPASKLRSVSLVASIAPAWELGTAGLRWSLRLSTFLAQWLPLSTLASLLDRQYGAAIADSHSKVLEEKVKASLNGLDEESKAVLLRPKSLQAMVTGLRAAYKHGSIEVAREMKLVACDWGFRLAEVDYSGRLSLHVGTEDCNMPMSMARRMAERLQGAVLHKHEGATHFTLLAKHGRQILEELIRE